MQPAVSVQDVPRVSPAWLRPSAFALMLCLHLLLLVGVPWPAGTSNTEPPPFEIEVISPAVPARLLVPVDSAPVVEVKSAKAVPLDVQVTEAQPLHGQEVAEFKPPEPTFAASSLQGVLVSPVSQAVELTPLAVRPPTAPVQIAEPAPLAAGTQGPAVPVDPPRKGPLPSFEQRLVESERLQVWPPAPAGVVQLEPSRPLSSERVAESKALEAPPAAPAEVAQPAHEAPPAAPSAPALDPPNKLLSPEPHAAESEPLKVRPAYGVVQPEPSRPLSSEQVAESKSLEARPTARAELAQPALEAPRAPPSVAIDPPRQPLSSEQVAELGPFGVPQAAAPVPVGPPVHEVPMAESSAVASNSPPHGTVLSSQQQVAKLEPYSPAPALLQEEGPIIAGRIGKIVRYVEQYDGGRCFFVAPVAVTETEAKLEGYGASARPFEALDTAFRHENGFEASIDVRLVNPSQCPAVTFLGRLRGTNAPHLRIDGVNLGTGEVLTGTVDGLGSRNVELLVATDAGTVQNMSHLLKPDVNAKTFAIGRSDIAWASEGQPQLLIVVASPIPLKALRFDRPVAADRVFAAALGEAERTNQPVAAMARYFKLER
jgi:hypothetical protein